MAFIELNSSFFDAVLRQNAMQKYLIFLPCSNYRRFKFRAAKTMRSTQSDQHRHFGTFMSLSLGRLGLVSVLCLVWLTGCGVITQPGIDDASIGAETTNLPPEPGGSALSLRDPMDDLDLGKRQFQESNFGLAEMHFRRAAEQNVGPVERNAEAWLGLAASYDRLRRFELADRAYKQAIRLIGPTAAVLNNQGYSYLMRGDLARARTTLSRARAMDPNNVYVQNNIALLEESLPTRRH